MLAAPDARARSAKVAGGVGTLVVSAGRERAVFVAAKMSAPPRGKVYQLWCADGGKMRSAGLMDPDRSSQAVLVQGGVDGARASASRWSRPVGRSSRPQHRSLCSACRPDGACGERAHERVPHTVIAALGVVAGERSRWCGPRTRPSRDGWPCASPAAVSRSL
ncbi:anti-sigma factor [Streptomyces sp. MMBL 11-3]|uniref:anti-sigma factor n=1 Tax=Streptomyces sp. MMBL 11-3 TaxID=3382639 RepID=UPI0039B6D310